MEANQSLGSGCFLNAASHFHIGLLVEIVPALHVHGEPGLEALLLAHWFNLLWHDDLHGVCGKQLLLQSLLQRRLSL